MATPTHPPQMRVVLVVVIIMVRAYIMAAVFKGRRHICKGTSSGYDASGSSLNLIDSPQPQASDTLGLLNLNPASNRLIS